MLNEHIKTFFEAADVILTKIGALTGIELPDQLSWELSSEKLTLVSMDTLREALRRLQKAISGKLNKRIITEAEPVDTAPQ